MSTPAPASAPSLATSPATVTLALVAHTNVGKTTLARTMLRRDVGEVVDMAHVTQVTESHELVRTDGARLVLEDTPGFGDTPRLLRRLKAQGNPLGWFLHQVWDRRRDRPLWCAQEAVRSAAGHADLVLYLVNAAETPEDAAYVAPEMEILAWIGKPVILLLNQTGATAGPELVDGWRRFAAAHPQVTDVLPLDAFTRCWVEERVLFERVAARLPEGKGRTMAALLAAWDERHLAVLARAVDAMAGHLARAAADRVALPPKTSSGEKKKAMEALAQRLEAATADLMRDLLRAHGLDGTSASRVEESLHDFVVHAPKDVSPRRGAIIGSIVSGALSGLAADLVTGGLSFGAGALIGAVAGAIGGAGLAKGYELVGSRTDPAVTWSDEALARLARATMARYLAVAHFGRGRGGYRDLDLPPAWDARVTETFVPHAQAFDLAWKSAARTDGTGAAADPALRATLVPLVDAWTRAVLRGLYPEGTRWLR